jgi:hypothetical protein
LFQQCTLPEAHRRPILAQDCAQAIMWLLRDASAKTTGHVIPVDGGLMEAFFR